MTHYRAWQLRICHSGLDPESLVEALMQEQAVAPSSA
jgi:hypothetical protein